METYEELSADIVRSWVDALDLRVKEVEQQVQPLLEEHRQLLDRRGLLSDLLISFGETITPASVERPSEDLGAVLSNSPTTTGGKRETVRDRVHREAAGLLREIGEPIHINDLAREYVRRGHKIPGQGKPANISVHLSGWDDIVSPERGLYAYQPIKSDADEGGRSDG